MSSRPGASLCAVVGAAAVLCVTFALCAEPSPSATNRPNDDSEAVAAEQSDGVNRVSVAVARDRAKLMHDIYAATLDMLHHRYFHSDRAVVPARAMEDVFSEIKRQSEAQARWISVNLKAMSIDHEPKSEFEKRAVNEIAAGKTEFEAVEDGYYRRAGAVRLTSGCISCHGGFFKEQDKTPKFAALVISVPVNGDSRKPD